MSQHPTLEDLQSALPDILNSPTEHGRIEMIISRPAVGERDILKTANLERDTGLVGDNWKQRGNSKTADGSADPDAQITLINSRIVNAVSGSKSRWHLAGDQFVVDIDLSHNNLPPGSQLSIGTAVVELTSTPHTGCVKFASRFGNPALRFVSGAEAMQQRRRGANAKIVQSGTVRVGDIAEKIA